MKHTLDKIDIAILNILKDNARTPIKAIADKLFISAPTVTARINIMEKAGIILGYHTIINDKAVLGHPVRAFINAEISPDKKTELYPFLAECPDVIECSHVTGEYSVLIQAVFESTDLLDKFISRLQSFGRTKTQIVFSTMVHRRSFRIEDESEGKTIEF